MHIFVTMAILKELAPEPEPFFSFPSAKCSSFYITDMLSTNDVIIQLKGGAVG